MKLMVLALLGALAVPAVAQVAGPVVDRPKQPIAIPGEISRSAPVNGVLVLYGNERCPTDPSGNEVVVCVRRSAQEQFRVPKELREFAVTPQNESWASRVQSTAGAGTGVNGIGSCSAVGPGGQSGCFAQRVQESRRENTTRAKEEPVLP